MFKKLGLGCLSIIGLFVVLGIVGAVLGGGARGGEATLVATSAPTLSGQAAAADAPAAIAAPTAAPAGPQVYAVGDVIQMGDVALAVLGWSQPEASQIAKPEAGKRFVGVELLVLNQGERAANLSTLAQMSLKDSEERRYTVDLMAGMALGGAAPDGELAPGERLRGTVGFQVPTEASGLTFVFDGGLFTSGKTFIALGDEPVTTEQPAALAGSAPAAAAVGELITVGDLTVTVNGVSAPEGSQFAKPAEGSRFLVVDLSITNNGGQATNVSTMLQMKLKDALGQQYNLDLMATTAAGGAAPEGELAPGETVRGPVGFQVLKHYLQRGPCSGTPTGSFSEVSDERLRRNQVQPLAY